MELRDCQKEAARKTWRSLRKDGFRNRVMLIQLPTGGGKTAAAVSIAAQWLIAEPNAKVTWITHRRKLERQSRVSLVEKCGIDEARLQVFSPLRAWNRSLHEAASGGVERDLLIIDEARHSTAKTRERLISNWPGPALGLSATPWRLSKSEGFDLLYSDLICGPSVKTSSRGEA